MFVSRVVRTDLSLGSIMLIEDFFIVDNFVVGHYKLRFGVPLMVGDVVPCLEPDPLLAFRKKPIVARGALSSLHESLVTGRYPVQVIRVVIVVTAGAEKLESEITYNWRSSMIDQKKFPLQAVTRYKF